MDYLIWNSNWILDESSILLVQQSPQYSLNKNLFSGKPHVPQPSADEINYKWIIQ